MSRSAYVFVVTSMRGDVLAAFTVKYELQDWLSRNETPVFVTRVYGQGSSQRLTMLNPRTLEPAI